MKKCRDLKGRGVWWALLSRLGQVVQWVGAITIGFVMLRFVALRTANPPEPLMGSAIVHVSEPDVDLTIDDWTVVLGPRRLEPLQFELERGDHWLVLSRAGKLLQIERFTVLGGSTVALVAYDAIGQTVEPVPDCSAQQTRADAVIINRSP